MIRLVDIDLVDPPRLAAVPGGTRLRLLVRDGRKPLGHAELVADGRPYEPGEVLRFVEASLGRRVRSAATARRLLPGNERTPTPMTAVVCTRDRAGRLDECLAALGAQTHPEHEVLVVDNAPSDGSTREVVERHGVRYALEPRPGLDRARNRGLAEATNELVAFTDDDVRPDPGWLEGLAAGFASTDVHGVTGLVVPAELETAAQILFEDVYGGMGKGFRPLVFPPAAWRELRPERCGVGCNMAFRRDVLLRLGGFDPSLDVGTPTGGGGDLDAFQRVLEAGGTIVYRPDAMGRHLHRRTMPELRRQLYDNGRGYAAMLATASARARGSGRLLIARRRAAWACGWLVGRAASRTFGRGERLPLQLILAELEGAVRGPALHRRSRREAAGP